MAILLTGGAGYIGSHACVEFLDKGYDIIVVDNLVNSDKSVIDKIKTITGKDFKFYEVDIRDKEKLQGIFKENKVEAVIHFAGFKAVGESVLEPLKYYDNNIGGTISLLEAMKGSKVNKIVFSSSATVYGTPKTVPIREDFPLDAINPYGRTKLMIEKILKDLYNADKCWHIGVLRYFNPIGAHKSGIIGEKPQGIPNNLMPRVCDVALGKEKELTVWGNDYPTGDGTGVRDYIHVVDLAQGHIAAYEKILKKPGYYVYNLGTGKGYSVLEIIETFQRVNGVKIPYKFYPRRPGDVAKCYADPDKAREELGWEAKYTLEDMCKDAWNFVVKNMAQ